MINEKEINQILTSGAELALAYVPKLLLAIVVLFLGFKVTKYVYSMIV